MVAGLWQTQAAFAIGLLGVFIGWRGSMAKMTGFFDLAGSVRYLLYGIVSGMILASAVDRLILAGIVESSLNIASASVLALLIALAEAALVMFLLGRPRNVALRASPPFGWTLGLGIGAMQASVIAWRLFGDELTNSDYSGFSIISVSLALVIAASSCIGHAIPAAFQGAMILDSKRFSPFVLAALGRACLTMTLILSIYTPLILIAPVIAIAAFWSPAHSNWIPSGLTPAARQAYRRTTRQSERHRKASESRTKGSLVHEDEESQQSKTP
tara:strand:+ start:2999 stop:3811 length:813 start_codon:yes stop_codon:yes gene_type:complete